MATYAFKIYRSNKIGNDQQYVWFEDSEHGLQDTLTTVAGLVEHIVDIDRPVTKIIIERVGKE